MTIDNSPSYSLTNSYWGDANGAKLYIIHNHLSISVQLTHVTLVFVAFCFYTDL